MLLILSYFGQLFAEVLILNFNLGVEVVNLPLVRLHGPSILAVKAKIYGVLYKQYSSITIMKCLVIGQC